MEAVLFTADRTFQTPILIHADDTGPGFDSIFPDSSNNVIKTVINERCFLTRNGIVVDDGRAHRSVDDT